jgi:tRNA-specific 2-thiouridylase
VVGTDQENLAAECSLESVNWCSDFAPDGPTEALVKIRYRHGGVQAAVAPMPQAKAKVRFVAPQASVTKGQSAVFYDGDTVLGGGVIAGTQ